MTRRLYTDVWLTVVVFAIASAIVFSGATGPLRLALAVVLVTFLPGHALTTAVFPARTTAAAIEAGETDDTTRLGGYVRRAALTNVERAGIAFGLSIAIVPLIGLATELAGQQFRVEQMLVGIGIVTAIGLVVGVVRRRALDDADRYDFSLRELGSGVRAAVDGGDRRDTALNVLLAISVVVAMSALGVAVTAPQDGSSYTSTYLLVNDGHGNLVAENFPTQYVEGESRPLTVVVENREHAAHTYTVVIELDRLDAQNNVVEETELQRYTQRVDVGQSWYAQHEITPTMTGENLRVTYLVYKDDVPADPTLDNAYRSLTLWIDVTDGSATNASATSNASAANGSASAANTTTSSDEGA